MRLWFGNPEGSGLPEGDMLILIGDEPAPESGVGPVVRVRSPEDVLELVQHLYGDITKSFRLVETEMEYEHKSTADDQWRGMVVNEFIGHASTFVRLWGNSTIDGLHGMYNLCSNIVKLLDAPSIKNVKPLACPVIAVGAGPSLDKVLPHLSKWRQFALIVSCDTAAKKLKAAGCDPHIVTPLERLNSTADKLAGYDGDAWFAGLPVVPKAAVDTFKRHMLVAQDDAPYQWAGIEGHDIFTGTTSGTMAVAVACHMTTGNVYLVGHDLMMDDGAYAAGLSSHVDQSDATIPVMGNDGQRHMTKPDWARAATDIAFMGANLNAAQRALFNVGAGLGLGIRITNSLPCTVEDMPNVPHETSWTFTESDPPSRRAIAAGRVLLRDFDAIVDHAAQLTDLKQIDLSTIIHERNQLMFAYIMRPLFCQISVERRLGRPENELLNLYKQRVRNMGKELDGVFGQMMGFFVGAS